MPEREDINRLILEPYHLLTATERQILEQVATEDEKSAAAVAQSRALSAVSEGLVFGEPSTSDAVFLAALRERLGAMPVPVRRVFARSARFSAALASACVFLIAVIVGSGQWYGVRAGSHAESTRLFLAALDANPDYEQLDAIANGVDLESLAAYLDIPEFTENWDVNPVASEPLTDLLLELDQKSLEEVLSKIEEADFF